MGHSKEPVVLTGSFWLSDFAPGKTCRVIEARICLPRNQAKPALDGFWACLLAGCQLLFNCLDDDWIIIPRAQVHQLDILR